MLDPIKQTATAMSTTGNGRKNLFLRLTEYILGNLLPVESWIMSYPGYYPDSMTLSGTLFRQYPAVVVTFEVTACFW